MEDAFDEMLDLMVALLVSAIFLPIILKTFNLFLDNSSWGFGTLIDKSQKASQAMMEDVDSLKGLSKLHYVIAPTVDEGFTNNQHVGSYDDYDRRIFYNEGTDISALVTSYYYNINQKYTDRTLLLTQAMASVGLPNGLIHPNVAIRNKEIKINRFGSIYFH